MRIIFFLMLALSLHAKKAPLEHFIQQPREGEVHSPWLTGPLLAPSSLTIPPGHYNIEPYIFISAKTAQYGSDWKPVKVETFWNNSFQPLLQFGLTKWLDFQLSPSLFYNYTKGAAQWGIGDMPILFDFQLYKRGKHPTDWIMGLKLALTETIPIGKYQKLNPKKLGTDVGGGGSWQTALGLVWGNMFYLGRNHFLTARFSFQYTLPAPVHVKRLNAYGGDASTNGTVYPAQFFQMDIGTELTLTQNWAFAMDIVGNWTGRTRFKGQTTSPNTAPSSAQFSLAPAIEYNWSSRLGIIFGPWFTVAGRNSSKFIKGVFALNYYH
jgi:hypothetical protein